VLNAELQWPPDDHVVYIRGTKAAEELVCRAHPLLRIRVLQGMSNADELSLWSHPKTVIRDIVSVEIDGDEATAHVWFGNGFLNYALKRERDHWRVEKVGTAGF